MTNCAVKFRHHELSYTVWIIFNLGRATVDRINQMICEIWESLFMTWDPFYLHELTLVPALVCNNMHWEV